MSERVLFSERERRLLMKIESAKQALNKLQEKRKLDIGALAIKHGLDKYDNTSLARAFENIQARELSE